MIAPVNRALAGLVRYSDKGEADTIADSGCGLPFRPESYPPFRVLRGRRIEGRSVLNDIQLRYGLMIRRNRLSRVSKCFPGYLDRLALFETHLRIRRWLPIKATCQGKRR